MIALLLLLTKKNIFIIDEFSRQLQCLRVRDKVDEVPGTIHPERVPPLRHVRHYELGLILHSPGKTMQPVEIIVKLKDFNFSQLYSCLKTSKIILSLAPPSFFLGLGLIGFSLFF